jgi:hypothetical protein
MIRDHGKQREVVDVLRMSDAPLAIETIRRACRIGSWVTAKSILLELMVQNEICGVKTSKSWIFWSVPIDNETRRKLP